MTLQKCVVLTSIHLKLKLRVEMGYLVLVLAHKFILEYLYVVLPNVLLMYFTLDQCTSSCVSFLLPTKSNSLQVTFSIF